MRKLRKIGAPALTGVPDATLIIGGIPALNADYETIVREKFVPVTGLVIAVTFLALLAGFRSVIAAAAKPHRAESALGSGILWGVSACFPGRTRQRVHWGSGRNGQHLSACPDRRLRDRLRVEHGL